MLALRHRRWLGFLVAAALAVAAVAVAGRLALRSSAPAATVVEGSARVGQPAPRVELPDLEASSRQVRLADLVGRPALALARRTGVSYRLAFDPEIGRAHV